MSEKRKRVPKLRFPGFTDDWEQRKLSTFFEKYQNIIYLKDEESYRQVSIRNTGIVEYRATTQGKNIGRKRQYTVDTVNHPITLTFTRQTVYEGGIGFVPHELNGAIVTENMPLLEMHDANEEFMKALFKTDGYYKSVIEDNTLTGSAQKALHENQWLNSCVKVPSLNEQRKIGLYFRQLDRFITLHQRKLDHLKDKKKSLLQKMFPKKGEDFPELRFPGFTGAWEQRKAAEIFKSVSDKGYTDLPVLSASQEVGMIRRDKIGIDIKYDKKSTKNYKRVKPGQFVIHLRSFQGGFAWCDIEGVTSPAYTVLDFKEVEKQVAKFWKEVLTSPVFIKRLETVTYGIRDGRSISFADFSALKFNVPSVEEQTQIGAAFSKIDHLITLHQRKLDHLQDLKKALLQSMFV